MYVFSRLSFVPFSDIYVYPEIVLTFFRGKKEACTEFFFFERSVNNMIGLAIKVKYEMVLYEME